MVRIVVWILSVMGSCWGVLIRGGMGFYLRLRGLFLYFIKGGSREIGEVVMYNLGERW